jgi:hypothetical protein
MLMGLSFDSSSTVCVPDAEVPPIFFHAAGNIGISSMVIQLLFLSLHPQTKNWKSGD